MTAPTPIDAYLAAVTAPDQNAALSTLRALIRRILPDAVECLSYAMPAHRQPGPKGKVVIGYAAFAKHCGVYSHSGTVAPLLGPDYPAWKASKSGFLFTPDHPLPDDLVHRMIALRLAEIPAYG
ncbi:MAG TPA: hypothetical protein PK450_06470 [Paracoccaceae bacterium]|nr:hypothetical protein [Paracoccaceae bacterium]